MKIILHSTHCPKCEVLKKKMVEKNIDFEENNDVEAMLALGISQAPILQIDGEIMNFQQAIFWVNTHS